MKNAAPKVGRCRSCLQAVLGQTAQLIDLGRTNASPQNDGAHPEELKAEYAGKLNVVFIDAWENPEASNNMGLTLFQHRYFWTPKVKNFSS